ncbi:glycerophosphodiester phosphodiesterase family protein [Aliiroseovarius sp.]|uniref:glycerophosphodiester phosphodiesterase family protein n=1 Tax=Aliiroseovarius sp. TaxID=1872442 RepID=UPI002609C410|nr:glycerophosphodiester phosphodiesterase family protein [Aliiroseovarius sp.]
MTLPAAFLDRPIAHRALHDVTAGRPENSRAAIEAAIAGGYGIEIDLQLSADGQAMVFHDYGLERLTAADGPVRQRRAAELAAIPLTGGEGTIPGFAEVLELVSGRVPLLIEIKDQDGAMGPAVGPLEQAAAAALADYTGPAAVMSFNPHSVAAFAARGTGLPVGLTTSGFDEADWKLLPADTCRTLRTIPDVDRVGASFISHDHRDLANPRVAELKSQGLSILCWTIRSPEEETRARKVADNVTFEGYAA